MNKKFLRFDNIWLWGIFFFLLLITINIILFHSFQYLDINKGVRGWILFWNYCSSESFKTVTISILIPLVLAIMGGIFKINDAIEQRIRAERQKRIDAQKECIQKTSDMWNEIYDFTSEVRFFKQDENDKENINDNKTIDDILIKIDNFSSRADDVINMWFFNFPMLDKLEKQNAIKASTLFVYLINILYDSSWTVAYCIKNNCEINGDTSLRDSLGIIQDVIENFAHHPIISILKRSTEPLEGYGSKKEETESIDKTRNISN